MKMLAMTKRRKLKQIVMWCNLFGVGLLIGILFSITFLKTFYAYKVSEGVLIGYDANFKTAKIPKRVTTIGTNAFYDEHVTEEIIFSENVNDIKTKAVSKCESLLKIYIPENVQQIEENAFIDCPYLTIYCQVDEKPEEWSDLWNADGYPVIWNCDENDLDENGYAYVIEDSIQYRIDKNREEAAVTGHSMNIGKEVELASNLIYDNKKITVTRIASESLSTLVRYDDFTGYLVAFVECLTIPDSVTEIEEDAFGTVLLFVKKIRCPLRFKNDFDKWGLTEYFEGY